MPPTGGPRLATRPIHLALWLTPHFLSLIRSESSPPRTLPSSSAEPSKPVPRESTYVRVALCWSPPLFRLPFAVALLHSTHTVQQMTTDNTTNNTLADGQQTNLASAVHNYSNSLHHPSTRPPQIIFPSIIWLFVRFSSFFHSYSLAVISTGEITDKTSHLMTGLHCCRPRRYLWPPPRTSDGRHLG